MNTSHCASEQSFDIGTLVSSTTGGLTRYGVVIGSNKPPDPRMVKVSWLWREEAPFSLDKLPYASFMYKNFLEVVY